MPVVLGLLWHPLTVSQLARSVRHRLSSTCYRKNVWVQRLNIVRVPLLTRHPLPYRLLPSGRNPALGWTGPWLTDPTFRCPAV